MEFRKSLGLMELKGNILLKLWRICGESGFGLPAL